MAGSNGIFIFSICILVGVENFLRSLLLSSHGLKICYRYFFTPILAIIFSVKKLELNLFGRVFRLILVGYSQM